MSCSHAAFFAFIALVNNGHTSIEPNKGFLLHRLAQKDNCPLDQAGLLKIQSTLLNLWVDKVKVMSDSSVNLVLNAMPMRLWNPDLLRPDGMKPTSASCHNFWANDFQT